MTSAETGQVKCPDCGRGNPHHLKFCGECGARLALVCAACGASNAPDQKFCGECGGRLGQDVAAGKFAPPRSYTQVHLARQVATARGAPEGERKHVTVMFCDIANSTALAERIGAEAMHALLNKFFELAQSELHRYECTINQFGGDGFMALAPVASTIKG